LNPLKLHARAIYTILCEVSSNLSEVRDEFGSRKAAMKQKK